MKKVLALILMIAMVISFAGCSEEDVVAEKSKDVIEVEELISDIGKVTLKSEEKIVKAEAEFDGLSKRERKQVENADELEKARKKFDEMKEEAQLKEVDDAILLAIEDVSIENAALIDEAKTLYDALPEKLKTKVKYADDLEDAIETLKELRIEEAEKLLADMHVDEDKVRSMSFYYPSAYRFYSDGSWAADITSFALPYIGRDEESTWLRMIYNYTGDDWVFFEEITLSVDGENFYKSFDYFDVTRDNGGGDVWEYVDESPSDADVEMLRAIADSEETIIRFEGDEYYHDYTVTATDKQSIKDVLAAYDALSALEE